MLKRMLGAIACLAALLAGAGPAAAQSQTMFRPVAVVNDSAITGYDLAQRAQIMVALGFNAASADALRVAALDRLIEDRLKLQEGKRAGLAATPEQIAAGIEEFAQGFELSVDELRATLSAKGVTDQALNDLVAADLVWRDLVRGRFGGRVEPGAAEIDAEIALVGQQIGVAYRLAEIGLPMTDAGRTEAETQALAERLVTSLNQGGDFTEAVRTYSRAPSAARGGEIGWVPARRLPLDVTNELTALQPGQVTQPLQVSGGLSILKVLEKRSNVSETAGSEDPELRERVRRRLINQQITQLAEGLMQELRRDAQIELR
jgi:peptidyl-prolyl cis-trans isomerase SurA